MTREQLIEVMAKAECLHDDPKCNWEALPERHKDSYRESQAAILDALTAAGMVVVNAKPDDEEIKKISEGMGWTGNEPTIRKWVECLIREMSVEAPSRRFRHDGE